MCKFFSMKRKNFHLRGVKKREKVEMYNNNKKKES